MTGTDPKLLLFPFGSPEYHKAWELREEVLRRPLGLSLRDEDLSAEAGQWHFGLFSGEGRLLACLIVAPLGGGRAKLRQMAVRPELQGQGLGRRLVQEVHGLLAARGIREIELHSRLTAVGFYEGLGYTVVGQRFQEVGLPHLRMERTLAAPSS